jgi:hypothetical protein
MHTVIVIQSYLWIKGWYWFKPSFVFYKIELKNEPKV